MRNYYVLGTGIANGNLTGKKVKKEKKSDNSFPVGDISKQIATQIIYNNSCYKSNGTWDT